MIPIPNSISEMEDAEAQYNQIKEYLNKDFTIDGDDDIFVSEVLDARPALWNDKI